MARGETKPICREDPILVAEDDKNDGFILERALRDAGATCPIHFCRDGLQLQECLNGGPDDSGQKLAGRPWLIITDLKMPRMDGLEFLRWRNEHSEFKMIPTIMLSASGEDPDIQEAYRLGANSYLVKPSGYKGTLEMMKFVLGYWRFCEIPRVMQLA